VKKKIEKKATSCQHKPGEDKNILKLNLNLNLQMIEYFKEKYHFGWTMKYI
jgi:hypothetical protein